MKIAVVGFHHESNTFNPIVTGAEDFVVLRKDEIVSNQNNGAIQGIINTLQSFEGYEVHPVLFARAVPNGVVNKEFYLALKSELMVRMRSLRDIDAITLSLHGSMRIEGIGDAEGDILKALRGYYPKIPIIAALDMHATISDKMMTCANAFVGYKCAPHTDTYETGAHAAEITRNTLDNNIPLTMSSVRIPMLIAGEKSETSTFPMSSRIARLRELEKMDKVLAASYFLGFPWADTETNGISPLVVTANDQPKADQLAKELANEFWGIREDFKFHTETYETKEAILEALSSTEHPTFLSDSGDNPTAGAAGDSTHLLRELLDITDRNYPDIPIIYAGFYDPVSVSSCLDNEGEEIQIHLGGVYEKTAGEPVKMNVRIIKVVRSWGSYQADLVHVSYKNIHLIIASKHIGWVDLSVFDIMGINPREWKLVIVKLGYLTEDFKEIAARSIMALSRGASHEVLENLSYKKVKRPVFPLDKDFDCSF